MLLMTIKIKR